MDACAVQAGRCLVRRGGRNMILPQIDMVAAIRTARSGGANDERCGFGGQGDTRCLLPGFAAS